MIASSRLEIAFEESRKDYKIPNYKIYKYEQSKGLVLLELEVRLIKRCVPSNTDHGYLDVDRTDCLPLFVFDRASLIR